MRFCQLDRIRELVPGERLVAVKGLTLAEEYLQDHFPRFPVMPGVLMLEAMYQASVWLIQATEDFTYSTVALSQANQVKYGDFVEPGAQLTVMTQWKKVDGPFVHLQTQGLIDGRNAVRGRLVLERFNLAERGLATQEIDQYLIHQHRRQFRRLQDPRNPYNAESARPIRSELNGVSEG